MKGTEIDRTADIGIIRKLYWDELLSDDAFIAACVLNGLCGDDFKPLVKNCRTNNE